jgi:hypothetical protein
MKIESFKKELKSCQKQEVRNAKSVRSSLEI